MIYFSREAQHKIYVNFYDSLRGDGYLITGKTEMLWGEASRKFVCVNPRSRVYKKSSQESSLITEKIRKTARSQSIYMSQL